MNDVADDPTLRTLRRLPVLEPDRLRAERVSARCRAAMLRRREKNGRPPHAGAPHMVLAPALLGGLGAGYLFALILDVLRLYDHR